MKIKVSPLSRIRAFTSSVVFCSVLGLCDVGGDINIQIEKMESHSLQLQVERVLSICRRLDPGSLFLRNKLY